MVSEVSCWKEQTFIIVIDIEIGVLLVRGEMEKEVDGVKVRGFPFQDALGSGC